MRGKHDLNTSFLGLAQLILLFALVHGGRPDVRYNWIFAIPIFILYIYSVLFCASDSQESDYGFAMAFAPLVLTASDYIFLRNRQSELRKIGQKKTTSEMTFTERLIWATSLAATPRGIGWAHEPTAIPPRPTASRRKFIVSQFFWILYYTILWNITIIHIRQNPCFKTGGPSLTAFGWWWRTTAWVYIVSLYCSISGMYVIGSIVFVATGLYEPKDWPHLFGSSLEAYTVRKCWGYVLKIFSFGRPLTKSDSRVWHQVLRKALTSHSNFFASALRLPRGPITTYFKLFISFFISGLVHAAGDYIIYQNFSQGKSIQFFTLQAVCITFEDAVIAIASRLGYKECKAFKLIGFIWVFWWFTFCIPMVMIPELHAGTMDEGDHVNRIQVFMEFTRKALRMAT